MSAAMISAVSVLSGVFISQAFSLLLSIFDKRHEKKVLLRQKYEEMSFYFADSLEWIKMLHSASQSRQQLLSLTPPPESRKVLSLCLLYFPSLLDCANQYLYSQVQYFEFVAASFDETIPCNAGGQAVLQPNYQEHLDKYLHKKEQFETLMRENVSKYIKA